MKYLSYLVPASMVIGASLSFAYTAAAATTAVSFTATDMQCPIVSTFMKQGNANNAGDVTRLQTFLKNSENLNVDVTGVYDQKTEDAVKAFQKKYADTVLTPWGATKASGIVYVTTAKKINQLACGQAMTLNSKELATISNYQNQTASVANSNVTIPEDTAPVVTYTVSQNEGTTIVTPAANNSNSLSSKFWAYFVALFH